MPDCHFVDYRIEIKSNNKDYNIVNLHAHTEAHSRGCRGRPTKGKMVKLKAKTTTRREKSEYFCSCLTRNQYLIAAKYGLQRGIRARFGDNVR